MNTNGVRCWTPIYVRMRTLTFPSSSSHLRPHIQTRTGGDNTFLFVFACECGHSPTRCPCPLICGPSIHCIIQMNLIFIVIQSNKIIRVSRSCFRPAATLAQCSRWRQGRVAGTGGGAEAAGAFQSPPELKPRRGVAHPD